MSPARQVCAALAGLCALLVAGSGAAQTADDTPKPHFDNRWAVVAYDADGVEIATDAAADQRVAAQTFAVVAGKQDYVFQIGCNPVTDAPFYRLLRSDARDLDFAGSSITPSMLVRYQGREIFQRDMITSDFNPDGYYRGPVGARLLEAMKDGNRLVITDRGSDFFMTVSLAGSRVALDALGCE